MQTVTTSGALQGLIRQWRERAAAVALVPTMGNLHEGHLRLIRRAATVADRVVVSIFVNPLQFNEPGDFTSYPRTIEEDKRKLSENNVHALFLPTVEEVYPRGMEQSTRVEVPGLSDILCGAYRPSHFAGVTTVVAVLLNMVRPDFAVFGEKDYQQLVLIRRMVADLHLPVKIVAVGTVRDDDGLALSSRNLYLSEAERGRAPALYRELCRARDAVLAGATVEYGAIERAAMRAVDEAGLRPEYVSVRNADNLALPGQRDRNLVILGAAWLGQARLIDNLLFSGA